MGVVTDRSNQHSIRYKHEHEHIHLEMTAGNKADKLNFKSGLYFVFGPNVPTYCTYPPLEEEIGFIMSSLWC